MFLDRKIGYTESLDFTALAEYKALPVADQQAVFEMYTNAYRSAMHLGQKIAAGKAHENAKNEIMRRNATVPVVVEQPVPPSIFASVDQN
jgi:hypothetical protein